MGDIAKSRRQRVFVVEETVPGTGATLTVALTDNFVFPAGNAVLNQVPTFQDSEELRDSLDILARFQNAKPPGIFTLPCYLRPSGVVGNVPQGDILFQSMQGGKNAATTASMAANISAVDTTLLIDGIAGGILPYRGVVTIGSEQIHYSTLTMGLRGTATTATLSDLTRSYGSGAAATHATNENVTLSSIFYRQDQASPSFSLWIETDHFVQGMSGCSVQSASLSVTNEGAVMVTFTGEGKKMVWAGYDELVNNAASGATFLIVTDADRFSAGAWIHRATDSTGERLISAVYPAAVGAYAANTIVLASGYTIPAAWATGTDIRGYLVVETPIGDPIESRLTTLDFDGVSAKFKAGEININVPKEYISDEIGTTFPEEYVENLREITSNLTVYFRRADAKYIGEGFEGSEKAVEIVFGDTAGSKAAIYFRKASFEVPTINAATPVIELAIPIKALGTYGEDSCEVRFE